MSETVRFTGKQARYIEWLAETKYDRSPVTRELLAKELGVTSRTLRRWQKLDGFGQAVHDRTRELLKDDFPEILGALRREAAKGNFQHIKLALEMLGEYTERQDVNTTVTATVIREVVVEIPGNEQPVDTGQ